MNAEKEAARLKSLREYDILDSAPEAAYDDLTRLAAEICGTPIAMVTIIDEKRQWTKARVGVDLVEIDREMAFCNETIKQKNLLVVSDLREDRRFAQNPFVSGNPHVRFYAGYPLTSREGEGLGSLCIVDLQPKELTDGQKEALSALGRQVTTQLELRRSLRELENALHAQHVSEERFGEFANNVDDVLWTVDSKTRKLLFVSPSYEKLWDRTRASLYEDCFSFLEGIHPEDRERIRAHMMKQPSGGYNETYRVVRRDGSVRWVLDRAFPHFDERGEVARISGIASDVTDRTEADRMREQAKESAESANRSKSEFLASMSHELRTPLNAILNISESLGEGVYGDVNPKQQHSLQTVAESGRHLLGLINDILDLSKIEAGKLELMATEVAVRPLCEASLRLVREQALNKSLDLFLLISPAIDTILADERKLKQILVNLLSNAVKFTPAGGRVGLEVELSGGEIAFAVSDTGIGISPKDLEKLFQPFVQLDSKLSREYAGTGLGLSLAQRLAVLHQGRIEVTSQPGLGSRFTAYLPAGTSPKAGKTRAKTQRLVVPTKPDHGNGLRVLLVDDVEANRECIGDYLTVKGFDMHYASNGEDAIEMAFAHHPDIILTDIQLSGMNGFETIKALRQNPKLAKSPIVALTALAMEGDIERCMAAGATAYMSKPVALKELVSNLLAISRQGAAEGPLREIVSS